MPEFFRIARHFLPWLLLAMTAPAEGRAQSPTVALEAGYVGELSANVAGGLRTGTVGAGNLDLTARADGKRLVGAEGLSLFLYGLATHGGEVTELTGDAQVASNIEAPDRLRLYEAWVQQNVESWRLSFLAGFADNRTNRFGGHAYGRPGNRVGALLQGLRNGLAHGPAGSTVHHPARRRSHD